MQKKIKRLLLIAFATVISISRLNVICQAKLKPGQFNKEMLKWVEPYKEREGIPDSWTWYPEYVREENDGILPKDARITNELDENTGKLFYDQYWVNEAIWGGDLKVFHNKDVGLTKDSLAYVGDFTNLKEHIHGKYNEDAPNARAQGVWEDDIIYRQVSKEIETYTGRLKAFLCVNIDTQENRVNNFDIFLILHHGRNKSEQFSFKDLYVKEFDNFSYKSLEKALDKYSKICFNYFTYLGADSSSNYSSISKNLNEGLPLGEFEKRGFFSSKISKVMGKSFNDSFIGVGLKLLDKLENLYSDLE